MRVIFNLFVILFLAIGFFSMSAAKVSGDQCWDDGGGCDCSLAGGINLCTNAGCSWTASCSGSPDSCWNWDDMGVRCTQCGCSFQSTGPGTGNCYGTPGSCNSIGESWCENCGCNWGNSCTGTCSCGSIGGSGACVAVGCDWCQNECGLEGRKDCADLGSCNKGSDPTKYCRCGYYDSDPCLEWGEMGCSTNSQCGGTGDSVPAIPCNCIAAFPRWCTGLGCTALCSGSYSCDTNPCDGCTLRNDGVGCTGNAQCCSGTCDTDDGWCFTCTNHKDNNDNNCEYDDGCGASVECDELAPGSCANSNRGVCAGTYSCTYQDCGAYMCSGGACLSSCTNDNHCDPNYFCDVSDSVCRPKTSCDTPPGGDDTDDEDLCEYSYCSAPSDCDELAVGVGTGHCGSFGTSYYEDLCGFGLSCQYIDDTTCESTFPGCTADPGCDEQNARDWCPTDGTWCNNICNEVDRDSSQEACEDSGGNCNPYDWDMGGDDCDPSQPGTQTLCCCRDDLDEYKMICQDGGVGACAESTDDDACCDQTSDCVYNNACYSDMEITPNGAWMCDMGTWVPAGVTVEVIATPTTATTVWQNTDATAEVNCTPDSPAIQCDPTSYALYTSSTSISSCSTTYSDYTLSDPQTISSHVWVCAAAKDTFGTEGFSDPVEFLVDQINPTASLSPLPAWTTQNSVTVGWSGSDTGDSGINQFELEYRVTMVDGSVVQDWAAWTTSSSNPGTLPFSDMQNNRTYHFRVRATDNAGNIGGWSSVESIGVDLVDPVCDVADLPMYTTSSSFIVNWAGSDGESGIQYYNVQVRVGESGTWRYLNDPDGYHTTETWDNVNGADGNTYFFRCNATDIAGNEGVWSSVKNTTVDATPPVSSVDPLPEWLNVTNFTVSWNGSDITSGVDCYDINWSDGSGWNSWFTCTQTLSSTFGPDSPVSVTEGVTYSFSSRATDNAGNVENWPPQPDAYTTIDLTPPQYDLRAYDQDGMEIGGFVQNLDTVTIRSSATDSISGVEHNYIKYILLNDVGETTGSQDCGSASPYGGISECNVTVDFAGAITLELWVEVIDRAGNMVISDVLHIGAHPLANFRERNVYMSMGEVRTTGIQVRNMQDQADNVTITISSNLPVAPYFIWVDDPDVEISGSNNETLVVRNVNPGATPPPFNVMLWSSDTASTYQVTLNASSALDITDSDQAAVQVGYPASFPGLNEWAIFVLIILAILTYIGLGKEMK